MPDDLKTILSLDSSGNTLTIKNELDGVRSFEMIKTFYLKIKHLLRHNKYSVFDIQNYRNKEIFLMSLCPLTIFFYLKLGPEIDFGIGVEKPIDRKQMASFLINCSEAVNISKFKQSADSDVLFVFCLVTVKVFELLHF